jgi:hypothetical protein
VSDNLGDGSPDRIRQWRPSAIISPLTIHTFIVEGFRAGYRLGREPRRVPVPTAPAAGSRQAVRARRLTSGVRGFLILRTHDNPAAGATAVPKGGHHA